MMSRKLRWRAGLGALVLLLVILSGFNFFAFAVLGEFVFRILQQVNATPRYTVRQIVDRDHLPGNRS